MKLKIMAIGTGRDGTVSLYEILNKMFKLSGADWHCVHEYGIRNIFVHLIHYMEKNDPADLQKIKQIFLDCHAESFVSGGYAFVLPFLPNDFLKDVKLIHLQRRDRNACIQSHVNSCKMFPKNNGNYCDSHDGVVIYRPTAFHFKEMSKMEWDNLSVLEKNTWYYNKSHELIRRHYNLFSDYIHVFTEELNDIKTFERIAEFLEIELERYPEPVKRNSFIFAELSQVDPFYRQKASWLFRFFDCNKAATDGVYALEYFGERFLTWSGYLHSGSIKDINPDYELSNEEFLSMLDRAVHFFESGAEQVKRLQHLVVNKK